MYNVFRFALQALALVMVFLFAVLGLNWLDPEIGQGLHPGIAFPIAFVVGYITVRSIFEDITHELHLARHRRLLRKHEATMEFVNQFTKFK